MREAAARALALDDGSSSAHMSVAMTNWFFDWDWATAEDHFRHAIALNPNNAEAHANLSQLLSFTGNDQQAIFHAERMYELEPDGIGILLLHPGWVRTRMGGKNAPYSPEQSVSGMRKLVESFEPTMSGRIYRFDGEIIPW